MLTMDLWQKHEVNLLDTNSFPYRLVFEEKVGMPHLDKCVAAWRDPHDKLFPESDLVPHRVGVAHFRRSHMGLIYCFPVTWAQYMLVSNGDVRETIPPEEHFRVLTVNCLVRTSDEQFALASRSKGLSHFGGMLHVSAAGNIDLHAAVESRTPLVQCFVELQEELNVFPCDIRFIKQLGLAITLPRNSATLEVCHYAEVTLTSQELLERAKTAKDSWEGKVSTFSETETRGMLGTEKFMPTGAATLMLCFGIYGALSIHHSQRRVL